MVVEVLLFRLDSCEMDCNALDNAILVYDVASLLCCFFRAGDKFHCVLLLLTSTCVGSDEMDMNLAGNSKMLLPHETVADAPIISRI
jgi:hypothetical protein